MVPEVSSVEALWTPGTVEALFVTEASPKMFWAWLDLGSKVLKRRSLAAFEFTLVVLREMSANLSMFFLT